MSEPERKKRKPRNRNDQGKPSALERALRRASNRRVHVDQRVSGGKPVLRVHVEGGES